jgi:adenylosuccinate lyase
MGLQPAPISTQVIQRDRHAEYLSTIAIIGTTLEKIATEIRHLQKTEVLEAEEFFSKGQKGSSAMPHKRNPIICERIAGMARLLRSNSIAALENVSLWHERDISHSSVERVIIPDSTIILDYMISKSISLIDNLLVYSENMIENLNKTRGLIFSQKVLLKITEAGASREEAYKIVQNSAMNVWADKSKNLLDELISQKEMLNYISKDILSEIFDNSKMLQNIDYIFNRTVFLK